MDDVIENDVQLLAEGRLHELEPRDFAVTAVQDRGELEQKRADDACGVPSDAEGHRGEDPDCRGQDGHAIGRQWRAQQPPGDPPRTPAIEMPVHEAFKAPLERADQRLLRLGRAGPPFGADVLVPVRSQRQHSHLPLANCALERRVHGVWAVLGDRKSTRLNSSHGYISYAVFCLKKKKTTYYIPVLRSPIRNASR